MSTILFALSACFLLACTTNDTSQKQTKEIVERMADVPHRADLTTPPECDALSRFPESLQDLTARPQQLRGIKNDSCFFVLVDSIAAQYKVSSNIEYLKCLDAICSISDGFTSEYMTKAVLDLFLVKPMDIIKYLYNKEDSIEGVERKIIWGIRNEIHYPSSQPLTPVIDSLVQSSLSSPDLSQDEKKYLRWLRQQWQKKWDDE